MRSVLRILRSGPLTTIQDNGRFGMLAHGVSASGPMDREAFWRAGLRAGASGDGGLEFTRAGLDIEVAEGQAVLGWDGGAFSVAVNGASQDWPGGAWLGAGDRVSITPGAAGNYGYLRFGAVLDLPMVLGSQSTSTRARLGGLEGRALVAGDVLALLGEGGAPVLPATPMEENGPIRFIWGIHAERFSSLVRERFVEAGFVVSPTLDRMGVRLLDKGEVFGGESILSLISDPILPGDIQILGDGTPVVLMVDHQPTGGYPRIGTIISVDLGRFAQLRPGSPVAFVPVSVDHAQRLLRGSRG